MNSILNGTQVKGAFLDGQQVIDNEDAWEPMIIDGEPSDKLLVQKSNDQIVLVGFVTNVGGSVGAEFELAELPQDMQDDSKFNFLKSDDYLTSGNNIGQRWFGYTTFGGFGLFSSRIENSKLLVTYVNGSPDDFHPGLTFGHAIYQKQG